MARTPETVKAVALRPIRVAGQGDDGHCEPGTMVKLPYAEAVYLHNCRKVHMAWAKDKSQEDETAELKKVVESVRAAGARATGGAKKKLATSGSEK